MGLTTEQRTRYAALIDVILQESDLNTISEKKIRKALSERLGYDVSDQKAAISEVIMERFDKISKITPQTPSNNAVKDAKPQVNGESKQELNKGVKRTSTTSDHNVKTPAANESDAESGPPKKKRKQQDSDARLAAKLQAEENSRARPSRGSVNKKPVVSRKKATPKKKSSVKIKADDDSDLELNSDGEKKEVVRKGGFHKPYSLSHPLATLLGESQLPRTQVVKKIWEHVHAMNLQDPNDKRQILCDDKMYAVFKQDKVHMFTMNKLLGKHLYPVEDFQE